jgi:hypothetical protein
MSEPDDEEVKDFDGFTWVHTSSGWTLKNHDQLCYQDLSWEQVEAEYGPMKLMRK